MTDSEKAAGGGAPASLGRAELTPTSFLARTSRVFRARVAAIEGDRRLTYGELAVRAVGAAGALAATGIEPGIRVALLATNSLLMLEAHFTLPALGAVMVPLNHRLTTEDLRGIVNHAGVRMVLHDDAFGEAASALGVETMSASELEARARGVELAALPPPHEERLLSINYTSGTTGVPKGVMYVHRGAYLQALAMAYHARLGPSSVYLWTLPMFHCHGWSFPWAVTAAGGTHVCLPKPDPAAVWEAIRRHGVSHLSAAPTVLHGIASDPGARAVEGPALRVGTGGAPPSPGLLGRLAELNVDVTHLYGLTETYGPAVVCEWQPEWDDLDGEARARLKARQGNANVLAGELRVVDADGVDVPADGATLGEVVLRGNNVMRGYYRDAAATRAATLGDALRTGDLAVMHPDGYIELRDRAKDIVISGGENVPSIEVEHAVASHPAVAEVAVVGRPDQHWGEVPVAFVTLYDGARATAEELIAHARTTLPGFKSPREVIFGAMPKTATGKIQKTILRQQLRG